MKEAGTGDFQEDSTGIIGQSFGELGPAFLLEGPGRVEKVGAVQNSSHHVPLGQSQRMVAYGIEHSAVVLAIGSGPGGAGGSMLQL